MSGGCLQLRTCNDLTFTHDVYVLHVPNGHRRSDAGLPLVTAEALLLGRPAGGQTESVWREPFVLQRAPVHRKWWEGSRQADSGGPVVLTHTCTHIHGLSAVMYVTTLSFQELKIHFVTVLTKFYPSPRRLTNHSWPLFSFPFDPWSSVCFTVGNKQLHFFLSTNQQVTTPHLFSRHRHVEKKNEVAVWQ